MTNTEQAETTIELDSITLRATAISGTTYWITVRPDAGCGTMIAVATNKQPSALEACVGRTDTDINHIGLPSEQMPEMLAALESAAASSLLTSDNKRALDAATWTVKRHG